MRIRLLAGVGLMVLGGSAWGADVPVRIPVKVPPVVAPPAEFSWTGCYLGGHVGGGWGRKDWSNASGFELSNSAPLFALSPLSLNEDVSGLLGGGQAGCKYQFASNWVVGIDADFSAAHIVGTQQLAPSASVGPVLIGLPTTPRAKTDWLASATGNLGYAFDRLLLYAKGGAAWAHDKYSLVVIPGVVGINPADFEARETRMGWTAGAGIEYAFRKNFSAKIEYDY